MAGRLRRDPALPGRAGFSVMVGLFEAGRPVCVVFGPESAAVRRAGRASTKNGRGEMIPWVSPGAVEHKRSHHVNGFPELRHRVEPDFARSVSASHQQRWRQGGLPRCGVWPDLYLKLSPRPPLGTPRPPSSFLEEPGGSRDPLDGPHLLRRLRSAPRNLGSPRTGSGTAGDLDSSPLCPLNESLFSRRGTARGTGPIPLT